MSGLMGGGSSNAQTPVKLASVQVSTSMYGKPKALVYGCTLVASNMIDWAGFTSQATTSGGKGGGGVTGYNYWSDLILALCEGGASGIVGVQRVWQNKDCYTLAYYGLSLMTGARPQAPWGPWLSKWPSRALGYSGTAYIAGLQVALGSDGAPPNYNFEVQALLGTEADPNWPGSYDAKPSAVVFDVLTNPYYGATFLAARIADMVTGAASFQTYCTACGFAISPAFTDQSDAATCIQQILDATNSEIVWSAGTTGMQLKIVPYGDTPITANGVTYTPNTTPLYNLTFDDFLGVIGKDGKPTGNDPISTQRSSTQDIKNDVPVEWWDRTNSYNVSVTDSPEPSDVSLNGLKQDSPLTLHLITRAAHAQQISAIKAQLNVFVRNTYTFKVGWKYILLEPMDLVTLTDAISGLSLRIVRIISVDMPDETSEEDGLTITAEDWPFGVGTAALYATQTSAGTIPNTDPGNANAPTIFQVPAQYSGGDNQLALATSGGSNWGGCYVWMSEDGASYGTQPIGKIGSAARHGTLTAALPAGNPSDTVNTLSVQLADSTLQLQSVSAASLTDLLTLCWVDSELIAFQTATLTGTGKYNLTNLIRGCYGTPISAHASGASFVRFDDACLTVDLAPTRIGTLYFKLQSYNLLGGGVQNISNLTAYSCTIASNASLNSPVSNLTTVYRDNRLWLHWDAMTAGISYEVRIGSAWASASVCGIVSTNEMLASGDGTYWVAPRLGTSDGPATGLAVSGTGLVANVVATRNESGGGWSGTKTGGVAIVSGLLELSGGSLSGFYQCPAGNIVDIGTAQACGVTFTLSAAGSRSTIIFDNIANVDTFDNVDGDATGLATVKPMISVAGNNGVFGPWQALVPGVYFGRIFQVGLQFTSTDPTAMPFAAAFSWTVDMPDRIQRFTSLSVGTGGVTATFSPAFQIQPNIQTTIHNAQAGDIWIRDSISASSVTGHISNGGVNVARTIDLIAQGY
jgi:hypothetical protein